MTVPFADRVLGDIEKKLSKNPQTKTLHISISSEGGDVKGGLKLYRGLRGCGVEIVTYNPDFVESAAVIAFLAGDKRYAETSATFMLHGVTMRFLRGSEADSHTFREWAKELDNDAEQMRAVYRERLDTKVNEGILDSFFERGDVRLNSTEALAYGLLTGVKVQSIPRGISKLWVISND